jgi:translation initiation factor eIF-2B subunit delta
VSDRCYACPVTSAAWEALIRELRADNRSSATVLARRAADSLPVLAELAVDAGDSQVLRRAVRELATVRPPFAHLSHLASLAAEAVAEPRSPDSLRARLATVGQEVRARLEAEHESVKRTAAGLLTGAPRVLTISASSLVRDALIEAAERHGSRPHVTCLESRPVREGAPLAHALAARGLHVQLAVDAAAARLISEADIVLVGGDTLSPHGLIHKLGTLGLALAAQHAGVPMYALLGSLKLLPAPVAGWAADGGSSDEVLEGATAVVEVWNRYFDQTPLALLRGVITERGIASPGEVAALAAATELHPWIAELLAA